MNERKINTDKRLPFNRRMKHLEVTTILTTQKKIPGGTNTRARRIIFRKKEYIDEDWWNELADNGELIISLSTIQG